MLWFVVEPRTMRSEPESDSGQAQTKKESPLRVTLTQVLQRSRTHAQRNAERGRIVTRSVRPLRAPRRCRAATSGVARFGRRAFRGLLRLGRGPGDDGERHGVRVTSGRSTSWSRSFRSRCRRRGGASLGVDRAFRSQVGSGNAQTAASTAAAVARIAQTNRSNSLAGTVCNRGGLRSHSYGDSVGWHVL